MRIQNQFLLTKLAFSSVNSYNVRKNYKVIQLSD